MNVYKNYTLFEFHGTVDCSNVYETGSCKCRLSVKHQIPHNPLFTGYGENTILCTAVNSEFEFNDLITICDQYKQVLNA